MGRIVWRKFYFLVPTTDVADLALTSVWNSFSPCFELEASTFTATTPPVAIVALYTGPNDPCPKIVVKLCVAFWISLEKHKALDKVLIIACESDKKKKNPHFMSCLLLLILSLFLTIFIKPILPLLSYMIIQLFFDCSLHNHVVWAWVTHVFK